MIDKNEQSQGKQKKSSVWKWILIGFAIYIAVITILLIIVGFIVIIGAYSDSSSGATNTNQNTQSGFIDIEDVVGTADSKDEVLPAVERGEITYSSLERAIEDNNLHPVTKLDSEYSEIKPGEYVNENRYFNNISVLTVTTDGKLKFKSVMDSWQPILFGENGDGSGEYERQLYKMGNYEGFYAFFRDPQNGDYTVIEIWVHRINGKINLNFSINGSKIKYIQVVPEDTGEKHNSNYSYSNSSSSSSSSGSSSGGKKEYNTHDYDPDDYDSPEDFADDAWGTDFDDWDDAYDYWENW